VSRFRAAFYHLSISFVIFIALAYVVLFVWFPDFFFRIDGGWEGMRILIGVDLVLGPLLTLMVFKAGKPGLKFDLTMIGTFQAACLAAGLYVIYSERPIFFIYYEQHFYSSSADTFTRFGVDTPDSKKFSDISPAYVYVQPPDNAIEQADVLKILYDDEVPPWTYALWYTPLDEHMARVLQEGISEGEIRGRDVDKNLDAWLEKHGGEFSDYAFFPIHSRYRDAFIGIRKSDGQMVDIVEIPPPVSG
jgi:hypothetical protein